MLRRPPTSTRTDTLFPYTTLFRSVHALWTLRNNDFQLEGSSRQSGEAGDDYVVDIKTESGHHGTEARGRSEEHTSELQSLMRISYAVFCLKKKKTQTTKDTAATPRLLHYTIKTHNKLQRNSL